MKTTLKHRSTLTSGQRLRGRLKVFVAMSGGVDSSVAAYLLKKQGYDVAGVFMRCYNVDGCAEQDAEDARRVAAHLGIPFYVFDFEEEYKKRVMEYMVHGYRQGITPNPDVMCNKEIKFGLFLKKALELGADYIATGHYVRIKKAKNPVFDRALVESRNDPKIRLGLSPIVSVANDPNLSRGVDNFGCRGPAGNQTPETRVTSQVSDHPRPTAYSLYQAKDLNKDQSYFLWTLTQEQLRYCLFPIGDYLKSEVREIARKVGLPTADKKDSQGICFLGKVTLAEFLRQYIPEERGIAVNTAGEKLGEHRGAHFYTIGQRRLGIANGKWQIANSNGETKPHYVAEKDVAVNTLVLAEGEDNPALYKREVFLEEVNFIRSTHSNVLENVGMRVFVRVRYRQPLAPATLICADSNADLRGKYSAPVCVKSAPVRVLFEQPQKAVAPGQSAVFYSKGGELLGGGVIQ